jgi:hypothetical protein
LSPLKGLSPASRAELGNWPVLPLDHRVLRASIGFRSPWWVRLVWRVAGLLGRAHRVEFTTFGYCATGWCEDGEWVVTSVGSRPRARRAP